MATQAQKKAAVEAQLAKGSVDITEAQLKKGLADISGSHENVTPLFKQEDPDFMEKLRDGAEKIARIQGERKELNASIAEVFASFENDGLNRHAVKAAIKFDDMNETDQENYDLTYTIMRKALGNPVQGDLFEAAVASELRDRAKNSE